MKLSILILSIPERLTNFLPTLLQNLLKQAEQFPNQVEILTLLDNKVRSIGKKRQNLIDIAEGEHIVFIDDDDRISDNYIEDIIKGINNNPGTDVFVFDSNVTNDGKFWFRAKYSITHIPETWEKRKPCHIHVFKTSIARKHKYKDMGFGEDIDWLSRVFEDLHNEVYLNNILYFYDFNSQTSQSLDSPSGSRKLMTDVNLDIFIHNIDIKFFYGIENKYTDITTKVLNNCLINNIITIPSTDIARARIFGDPNPNILKHIIIQSDKNIVKYHDTQVISIPYPYEYKKLSRQDWWEQTGKFIEDKVQQLNALHNYLTIKHGNIKDELPEQLMAIKYINPDDTVLELGSNIGRNTCIIAQMLSDDKRLVTLECNPIYVVQLTENRNDNNFNFQIESSALSKKSLIQRGWETTVSDIVPDGFFKVNTIDWSNLQKKYNLKFTTLVADCEGALYYILQDEPDLLQDFQTIIMENDFLDISHKKFVDANFIQHGFTCVYREAGGWGPCSDCFFEIWQKNKNRQQS